MLHLFRISTLIVKLPWLGSIETTLRAQKPVFLQDRYTSGQKKSTDVFLLRVSGLLEGFESEKQPKSTSERKIFRVEKGAKTVGRLLGSRAGFPCFHVNAMEDSCFKTDLSVGVLVPFRRKRIKDKRV